MKSFETAFIFNEPSKVIVAPKCLKTCNYGFIFFVNIIIKIRRTGNKNSTFNLSFNVII